MPDNQLDKMYGIQPPQGQAKQETQAPGLLDPKSVGAKTLQSATFGFGADVAGMVFGHQSEAAIRELEKNYDKAHPFASAAIDLAVAVAEGAATGGGSVAAGGIRGIAKGAAMGAGFGALHGAGQGGTLEQRANRAADEGVTGALGGAAFGALGTILKPFANKMGFSTDKQAADAINVALKKDGKSMQELESFMRQNPNARIADFSPKVADLVGKAAGGAQDTARQLGSAVRQDVSQQATRLQNQSSPLQNVKDNMMQNLQALSKEKNQAYKAAYSEVTPLTPELKAALDHPDVQPLVKGVLEDYQKLRMNPNSNVAQAPQYKVGSEMPTAVIDDLQKRMGDLARDPSAMGKMQAGALQHAQAMLKEAQPATLDRAQQLAAKLGGDESGIIGAQTWGGKFAFGLKSADIEQWRGMNPLQREYARLGMTDGLERYLADKGRLGEQPLRDIAQKLRTHPEIREVLGPKDANSISKVFSTEADRMRTSTTMISGGSKRAMFNEENEARILSHGANVAIPGHVAGTAARMLMSMGMPEKVASRIIDTATKPGGLAQLKKDGMDQRTLDRVASIVRNRTGGAAIGGRFVSEENAKSER